MFLSWLVDDGGSYFMGILSEERGIFVFHQAKVGIEPTKS
jgi:hypothetical protein